MENYDVSEERGLKMSFMTYFDGVPNYIEGESKVSTYQLGLTDLRVLPTGELEVELRRPGLLIGKGGRDLDKLKKFLGVEIKIKEKKFI